MEQENKSFVHDTINLEEIKNLLGEEEQQRKQTAPPEQKPPAEQLPETEPEKKKTEKPGQDLYAILHDIVYILMIVTILFVFVVRLVGVDGNSMYPTLHHRDYLLLESNFIYGPDDIENGDIVVLYTPLPNDNEDGPIVKRVIATEGQTLDIDFERGEVYVDGVLLEEPYINELTYTNFDDYGLEYPVTVPENCIFVMGDNRNHSLDSRFGPIGMVDESCVLGKVLVIAVPGQTKDESGRVTESRDWSRIGLVS